MLEKRFFQSLQLILDSIWKNKDLVIPIKWMLFIKLQTWGARSMQVVPVRASAIDPVKIDAANVTSLTDLAVERNVSIPSFVIKKTVEIMTRFIAQHLNCKANFQALGCGKFFFFILRLPTS